MGNQQRKVTGSAFLLHLIVEPRFSSKGRLPANNICVTWCETNSGAEDFAIDTGKRLPLISR